MLFAIFVNSLLLALYDYRAGYEFTELNLSLDWASKAFTLLYSFEMVLHIAAQGLFTSTKLKFVGQ
jgi:hypothetical protein